MNKNNNIETPSAKDAQKIPLIKLKPYTAPKLSLINELDIESGGQNMNESLGTGNMS
ncbi:MAG: hypothetical protein WC627_12225 [Legionella sp.]